MSDPSQSPRFPIGHLVMCNLGERGWHLGRIIALQYREAGWPKHQVAPYQVALELSHNLVYVPEDDERFCREASEEDIRIFRNVDALSEENRYPPAPSPASGLQQLDCTEDPASMEGLDYRSGRCHCCHSCPRSWSYVELYSQQYRCASRNGLKVTGHSIDLGTLSVGAPLHLHPLAPPFPAEGYLQCPTLMRLPPGLRFADDASLSGSIQFDPYRKHSYQVEFVAVSTAFWKDPEMGLIRLEIRFQVSGNTPPPGFNLVSFQREQQEAHAVATRCLMDLSDTWDLWESNQLEHRDTCDRMTATLAQLRELLMRYPRLDEGLWWMQLGGYHMNIHKLLENTLFECELYLGYALSFGNREVRSLAEQNLKGCYQKRQLEAARFMWVDAAKRMMKRQWQQAMDLLQEAALKKEGWGWAVNYGDIWIAEAQARIVLAAQQALLSKHIPPMPPGSEPRIQTQALLDQARTRAEESGVFADKGHPWISEVQTALNTLSSIQQASELATWLETFIQRCDYWCAQILAGMPPFPPQPRARLVDKELLRQAMPEYPESQEL